MFSRVFWVSRVMTVIKVITVMSVIRVIRVIRIIRVISVLLAFWASTIRKAKLCGIRRVVRLIRARSLGSFCGTLTVYGNPDSLWEP
jgi:hypothetical protein